MNATGCNAKYIVKLDGEERDSLRDIITKGSASARKILHARILLKADQAEGQDWMSDSEVAKALDTSKPTVHRVRKRLVEEGLDAALNHRPRPPAPERRSL